MDAKLLILAIALCLSACGGSESASAPDHSPSDQNTAINSDTVSRNAPVIGAIFTDVISFSELSGRPENAGIRERTIEFTVAAEVFDPDGEQNLDFIDIKQIGREWYWELREPAGSKTNRNSCQITDNLYQCSFYDNENPHSVQLRNWEIIAGDLDGNVTKRRFNFTLPNSTVDNSKERAITEQYKGSKVNTLEALKPLSASNNGLFAYYDSVAGALMVEFISTDARVQNYQVELYSLDKQSGNPAGNWVFSGHIPPGSSSIASTPIIAGQKTKVAIPYSEFLLFDGTQPEDIEGVQIVLFDEFQATPSQVWEGWFNYVAVSELVELW